MWLRNRFLSTASFLPMADGEGNGGGGQSNDTDPPNDATLQGDDQQGAEGASTDDDSGDNGGDEGSDDDSGGEGGSGDDDDELDLDSLPPEIKRKVAKTIERETTWRDRQIDRLYRKNREAQGENESLRTIASRQPGDDQQPAQQPQTPEAVQIAAQQLRMQEKYNEDSNRADEDGRKTYGDKWSRALDRLPKMGGVNINDMVDILATDNPHVVLYSLGSNPELYDRVMNMPPARRRNEFVKMGMVQAPPTTSKTPSKAPPPVNQLKGNRAVSAQRVDLADEKIPDDKWYEERNRTRRKKFSNVE